MTFVVDSSIALTWCFGEEQTPETMSLLARVSDSGAFAPSLWPLEVLNALLVAEKRKRVDFAKRHELVGALHSLPIKIDTETVAQAWTITNRLAEQHRLTLYDATYLELAQRLNLPLATLDVELRTAAGALDMPLMGMCGDPA
jgi:predicted nucleic acid-binding protein